jgi:hypothetical protein
MTTAQELTKIVSEAAKDTPYTITPTDDGFELRLNIVDAKWILPLGTGRVDKYFTITAKLDESTHQATLNDTLFQLEWMAGIDGKLEPHIGAKIDVFQGEVHELQFGVVVGTTDNNNSVAPGVTTYSFSGDKAKKWLQSLLNANGWKKKFSVQTKIGIAAVVFAGLVGLTLAILFATGVIQSN